MDETIHWLIQIELLAEEFYRSASACFEEPDDIQFLKHCADDEAFHYQVMAKALETVGDHPGVLSAFNIDQEIKDRIDSTFQNALAKANGKTLDKEKLIDCIVATEFSEWNDFFIFVVNYLKRINPEFKSIAAKLQHHIRHIQHFLNSDPYGRRKVSTIQKLKPIWTEKILLIEDDSAIAELLASVLRREGAVDTAENGKAAFEIIRKNFYRMIISDIDMPVMDGLTLFQTLVKQYPGIENRYLFYTGFPTPKSTALLDAYNVTCLQKPVSILELKKRVMAVLHNILDS